MKVGVAAVVTIWRVLPTGALASGSAASCVLLTDERPSRDAAPQTGRTSASAWWAPLGACAREVVGTFVHTVPGVALTHSKVTRRPLPARSNLWWFQTAMGFLLSAMPRFFQPGRRGHDVDRVLRVGEDVQLFAVAALPRAGAGSQLRSPRLFGKFPAASRPRPHVSSSPSRPPQARLRRGKGAKPAAAVIVVSFNIPIGIVPDRKGDGAGATLGLVPWNLWGWAWPRLLS